MIQGEEESYRLIFSSIVKCIVVICITVFLIFWSNSCDLDASTIEECEAACNTSGSKMESVTAKECVCQKATENTWVIPR